MGHQNIELSPSDLGQVECVKLHDILLAFYCSLCTFEQTRHILQYASATCNILVPRGASYSCKPLLHRLLVLLVLLMIIYLSKFSPFLQICTQHGNSKGESVVAAILLSRMEVNYCTSGYFHS